MIMNKLAIAALMSLALVQNVKADGGAAVDVSVDARVTYEYDRLGGDVGDYFGNPTFDFLYSEDINVTLTAQLADKIKAKLRMDLSRLFGGGSTSDKLERALEEATIEIREINGTPIAAVIFGKQNVFGDKDDSLPGYTYSLLSQVNHKDEVIGLTVKLKDVLGFAIQASAFETQGGDLQIANNYGYSVMVSRQLTDRIRARAEAMYAPNDSWLIPTSLNDIRAVVGFVYDSGDGRWNASVDGMYIEGNFATIASMLEGAEVKWAAQAKANVKVGPGTVRVSAAYLQNTAYELAAGYELPVADGLTVTPAIRYLSEDGNFIDVTRAMLEARVRLGNNPRAVK